jgi:hypothetical protein
MEDNNNMDLTGKGCGLDSSGSVYDPMASSSEYDNKSSGPMKTWNFLTI